MNYNSRTQKSLKNISSSLLTYLFNTILQFLNRTVFLIYLSIDYLGINGLFSNLISMLNLAELGIAGAMVYALYKPLAEKNTKKIKSLMFLYKKLYTCVGIIILSIGFLITPFLDNFINISSGNIDHMKFYFILYVLDTGISYFLSYKRSIIICDQKQYIVNRVSMIRIILTNLLQITMLIITKNYTMYLIVKIISTFIENVLITSIANKRYPFLKEKACMPSKQEVKKISKNILAMSMHKIGTVIVFSTDNLIITKFVSLAATGIYSNYTLIVNALTNIIAQLFQSVTASVGNLIANEDNKEHIYDVFKNIFFMNYVLYLIISIGLFYSVNTFISMWVGSKYTLDQLTIICIVLSFFSLGMRKTVMLFKDADGLFWNDRYKPLLEAACNLLFSIPLAIRYGIAGTLIGTIITNIFVAGLIEAYVTYKYLFQKEVRKYYYLQLKYYLIFILLLIIFANIKIIVNTNIIIEFIIRGAFAVLISILSIVIIFRKTNEYKYVKSIILKMLKINFNG